MGLLLTIMGIMAREELIFSYRLKPCFCCLCKPENRPEAAFYGCNKEQAGNGFFLSSPDMKTLFYLPVRVGKDTADCIIERA